MKLKNLKGKEVTVNLAKHNSSAKSNTRQSKVVEITQEIFPFQTIYENFTIPGSRLSLDIFIPSILLAIEIQGEQHQEYNAFFHGDKNQKKFVAQKNRDQSKKEWCEANEIILIEVFPKEKEDVIRDKIVKLANEGRAGNIINHRKV